MSATDERADGQAPPPALTQIGIIGGGVSGLTLACGFVHACPELVLLERSASLGGVWASLANEHSIANVSQPAYSLPVPPRSRGDRVTYHEMLEDVRIAVKHHELAQKIVLNACVRAVTTSSVGGGRWAVRGWCAAEAPHPLSLCSEWVILALGGRLGAPRRSLFSSADEARFAGALRRGLHDDCRTLQWTGARVVVIGCGPFALEHVRCALEHDASHVTVLCRRAGLVVPAAVEHLQHRRPSNR